MIGTTQNTQLVHQQNSLYGHYELGIGEVHALKINFGSSFFCANCTK